MDASGSDDWPPPVGKSPTKFYVLTGLSIQPEAWDAAYVQVTGLRAKYFPDPDRRPVELHYSELIAKKGRYGLLSEVQRKSLADEVFEIIRSLKPTLFSVVVDKLRHYNKYGQPEHPKQLAMRFIAAHFSKFLQNKGDTGLMIYDTTQARNDAFLRVFLEKARRSGLVLQTWDDPFRTQNRLNNVIESIFFLESDLSPVIQLVDFCAYAVFSKFEHGKDERYKQILDLFDRNNGNIWGLVIWPR